MSSFDKTVEDKTSMATALDALFDAIDDAADGQEAWMEHGPYVRILHRAAELRYLANRQGLNIKKEYEPKT